MSEVRIDASLVESTVLVNSVARFGTLRIDEGDTLHLLSTGVLGMGSSIFNSGTLRVDARPKEIFLIETVPPQFTISGGGTMIFDTRLDIYNDAQPPVVNVDNTIRGGLSIMNLDNHGTIIATSGKSVGLWNIRNSGRIAAESGGMVSLMGFPNPVADNTGGVVEAEDGGRVVLGTNGVFGGTLKTSGTGSITVQSQTTLTDLTLDGVLRFGTQELSHAGQRVIVEGTIHNVGTIDIAPVGSQATLQFGQTNQPVYLTGGGFINLSGSTLLRGGNLVYSDNTIRGSGLVGGIIRSTGRIIAAPGGVLRLSAGLTNDGTMQVEPGGNMSLGQNATYHSSNGRIQIAAGGTFTVLPSATSDPSQIKLTLNAGSIELDGLLDMQNGTINSTGFIGSGALNQTGGYIHAGYLKFNGASISAGTTGIFSGGRSLGTSRLNALSISGTGRLDLTDHDLILDYDPAAPIDPQTVRLMLASAYANGAWTGPGLASSAAGSSVSPNKTSLGYLDNLAGAFTDFSGQSVDDTSILIKYTLAGDANLDGRANLVDLVALANHWQMPGFWENGDFNYDGVVNSADLGLLAMNWETGNDAPLSVALAELGLPAVAVPEPWGLAMLLIAAIFPGRRLRRA